MTMASQRRGPWSQREDDLLMSLVQSQGPLNWVRISQQLHSRTPKQCRERYHQNLKPTLNHDPITPEEGILIEKLVNELGKRWAEIARRLNNRSDNAVKNWWNGSMNRRRRMLRRKPPSQYYEDPGYPQRGPGPLRLDTVPHAPSGYSAYPPYSLQTSPSTARFPVHMRTGLPSPSITSPFLESPDGAPSLLSDNGSSRYSTSPTSAVPGGEQAYALPPLRSMKPDPAALEYHGQRRLPSLGHGLHDPSASTTAIASSSSPVFSAEPRIPSLGPRLADHVRLPPIRDYPNAHDQQLPTAPSSPMGPNYRAERAEEQTAGPRSTMSLSNMLG
ncbi:Homeodomain-like protein [Xylariaceae sp. FL0255]|nr:Homeodomain-like protein [Xylariaceae sp. FL0255]